MKNKFLYLKQRCNKCKGKGYTWSDNRAFKGQEEQDPIQCDCLKKMVLYTNLDNANVPREYYDYTLEDFKTPSVKKEVIKKRIQEIIDDPETFFNEGRNIFFFGPNGSGKTMLSIEILKAALAKKHTIHYDLYPIICEEFSKKGFKADDVKDKYDRIFANVDFLVIDEIYKENEMAGTDAATARRLLEIHILKKRGTKPTIFLGNIYDVNKKETMSKEDAQTVIGKRYGLGVLSMMRKNYEFLNVWDEDFRGKA